MRVNPGTSPNIQGTQTEGPKKTDAAVKTERARATEKMGKAQESLAPARSEISDKAKEFAKARSVAMSAPDVREERIAELKKRIASGEYSIDSDKVADKMISDHAAL